MPGNSFLFSGALGSETPCSLKSSLHNSATCLSQHEKGQVPTDTTKAAIPACANIRVHKGWYQGSTGMDVQASDLAARKGPGLTAAERSMCENYSVEVSVHPLGSSWSVCPPQPVVHSGRSLQVC